MRGSAARVLAPGLLVLALVGVVAVASRGSTPDGSSDTRTPSDALLDTFFSFVLVAMIPAAAILVWGLMQRKDIANRIAAGRLPRTGIVAYLAFMLAVTALGYWSLQRAGFSLSEQLEDIIIPGNEVPQIPQEEGDAASQYRAEFAWIPVLVVVCLAVLGFGAAYFSRRRRSDAGEEAVAQALVEVLDDTLDDLRAEVDPRKAVIAAYARLERTLAAHGSARKAAETPEEYLDRILPRLAVGRPSIRRLTDLFTRAKFSQHDVDVGMKEEAIDALVQVRDELRAAAEARPDDEPVQTPLRAREERA
jgi:hypothetical protein